MVVFSRNGTNDHPYAEKKINPNLNLIPYTKNNSKWCVVINIKHKALKLLENIGENLYNLSLGKKKFLARKPKAQYIKEKIDK